MPDDPQTLTRWRLVLGKVAEGHGIGCGGDDRAERIEQLVGFLFETGGDGQSGRGREGSGDQPEPVQNVGDPVRPCAELGIGDDSEPARITDPADRRMVASRAEVVFHRPVGDVQARPAVQLAASGPPGGLRAFPRVVPEIRQHRPAAIAFVMGAQSPGTSPLSWRCTWLIPSPCRG